MFTCIIQCVKQDSGSDQSHGWTPGGWLWCKGCKLQLVVEIVERMSGSHKPVDSLDHGHAYDGPLVSLLLGEPSSVSVCRRNRASRLRR